MRNEPKNWGELRTWIWTHHYRNQRSSATAKSVLDNAPLADRTPLPLINRPMLRDMIAQLEGDGKSAATVRRYVTVVMKALREAMAEGFLDAVPTVPTLPKVKRGRIRYLSASEEHDLMLVARDPRNPEGFRELLVVLLDTGLRLGEALSLRWGECRDGVVTVLESKNDTRRQVPMTDRVMRIIEVTRGDPGRARNLGPFTHLPHWRVHRAWSRCRADLRAERDEEFVPHCLRHTFASRLVQRGAGLQVVKELMGHKRLENTMIYAHLAPAQHRAAIDLLEVS